eukprot:TRINITY_DN2037_c0_g1_i4.p1 TRINITY_DN2037_c0_g1~~TRINITY_DN2037_c0_g1_i4.p1  ORF type:complete len:138 (-),score=30.58 TRINITY_DN2037_c0_g1_i4:141-554(-)
MGKGFKENYALEKRRSFAAKIRESYPDRVPVIVERMPNSKSPSIPEIQKRKFLAPMDMSVAKFQMQVRKHLDMTIEALKETSSLPASHKEQQAIFLFVNKTVLAPSGLLMSQIYETYKDVDGFLYINYSGESTFGGF